MVRETWVQDNRDAEQLAQEIMELINDRNSIQRTGGSGSAKNHSSIRVKLQQLSEDIKTLKTQLGRASASHLITPQEADRRQNQIDSLISREKQLNQAFKPSQSQLSSGRVGLLNEGFDVERGGDQWGSSSRANEDLTPESYRQQQSQIMKEQDKGLDSLHAVIKRQKMMGHAIGEEIDYQNDLIDEITDGVDHTERKLINAETKVKKVTKKAGSCALMIIIVLLFLGIVAAAAIPN